MIVTCEFYMIGNDISETEVALISLDIMIKINK